MEQKGQINSQTKANLMLVKGGIWFVEKTHIARKIKTPRT
jgi:hypothetical protein